MNRNTAISEIDTSFTLDDALLEQRKAATAHQVHATQIPALRSAGFVILCVIALSVTAVPLVLLLFQLFDRGLPVILHMSFYTQLPATPSLLSPLAGAFSDEAA